MSGFRRMSVIESGILFGLFFHNGKISLFQCKSYAIVPTVGKKINKTYEYSYSMRSTLFGFSFMHCAIYLQNWPI